MSRVEQIEMELAKFSPEELKLVRDWLDEMLEDGLTFTHEFEAAIRQSERELARHGMN